MELLKQFFTLFGFLVAYHFGGIFVATLVAMVIGMALLAFEYTKTKRVEKLQLASLAIILIMGGLTLFFQDERFIKMKPTLLNLVFAGVFFGSVVMNRPVLAMMFKNQFTLSNRALKSMTCAWGALFLTLGLVNIGVALTCSTEIWVYYKVFGQLGLMLLFVIAQSIYLSRTQNHDANKNTKTLTGS